MFQQFQTLSTPSKVTLARKGNPTVFLTSSSSSILIIDSGASDHITEKKNIVSS